jgi:pyruvate-formate lyase-activating enzyme|tara:strand:+ start:3989 stop:5155 length:1167 start_codon:yes stop_codon:yes gene_type:complete
MAQRTSSNVGCSEPYKQIHFDSVGNLGPCCQYVGDRPTTENFDEYLSSDWLANLKNKLDNGERVSGCDFCWKQEDKGAKSMRQKRNAYYEGKADKGTEHIMITFGNQCNTACRICNASRSSLIEKQYKAMASSIEDPNLYKLVTKKHDWTKTKTWYRNIVNDIVDRSDTIRKLEISGGEPFINVHFDRMIDSLIASGKELPGLNITTNGSFTENQIQKLEAFDHLHINYSIDGSGKEFYEYLRWPLKWNDTLEKIDILKKYPWITCEFAIVPHNLNILNLADSIEFFKEYTEFQDRFKVGFSWLNGAPWYKLDNTPVDVRQQAATRIKEIDLTKYSYEEQEQITELYTMIKNANSPSHMKMLTSHVEMTDRYRNCNTWNIIGWHYDQI